MGDLMTESFTYTSLEAQYGNFIVPALKIKVDGNDTVKSMGLVIENIEITLSLEASGSVVFKIAGAYDEKSHSFQSEIKSKFQLGTVVEVEIGYLSTTKNVFKGYVSMLGADFSVKQLLVVTLMDARRLMMTSGEKKVLHSVKNYSEAVKKILDGYGKLCTSVVDATSDSLDAPVFQNSSDYDFIARTLIQNKLIDREFFIFADKAYFRKPQKITEPALTIKYGRELQSLNVNFPYIDLQVDIVGYDPKEQTSVKSSEQVKGFMEQKKIMGKTPVLTDTAPHADSPDSTGARAAALARVKKNKNCTGNASTIGLPEIVPGRYLKVEALEEMIDNNYYIKEVTHVMSEKNFTTNFRIEGVK